MGNDGPSVVSGGPGARGRAGVDPGGAPKRFSKIYFFDSESALGAAPPSGPAGPLGVPPEITDGLMDPPGRVLGVGGSTGALFVSHDVYRGRSDPEFSQN